jgi:hypothetical protein
MERYGYVSVSASTSASSLSEVERLEREGVAPY